MHYKVTYTIVGGKTLSGKFYDLREAKKDVADNLRNGIWYEEEGIYKVIPFHMIKEVVIEDLQFP